MPDSSSRKTCYWIREGKSFSSNGNQTVRKGSRFQFPVTYENSNFRLDWYALRVPIWTKAFPCPFNLDQQRLLEVKQLVWIQNIPLLQYEIQIDCETDKLRVQQRCTWLKYETLNTIYRYYLYVSHLFKYSWNQQTMYNQTEVFQDLFLSKQRSVRNSENKWSNRNLPRT